MQVKLLAPHDTAWTEVLSRTAHDFHHLPAYVELCARTTELGRPVAFLVHDNARALLLPVVIRDIPGARGLFDAVSPYGYPGPLLAGASAADAFVPAALAALMREAKQWSLVSLFVRLHPLLNEGWGALSTVGTLVRHGETVVVDLSLSDDEIWRQTQSGHRNEINRSLKAGHRAYLDEDWRHLKEFGRLYRETMQRVEASQYYLFPDNYFAELRAALGGRLHLAVVEIDGTLAAAGLFTRCGDIVQYHLSGMSSALAHHRPTKLMLHRVRAWAKASGARWLHLGGGVGAAADSLFKFKAGFSKQRRTFETWRVVTDEANYVSLCAARSGPGVDRAGFFPEYRR